MNEHKDPTFIVLGQSITLISDECAHGLNTVADMGDFVHYMGDEYPTISTAIFAYQEIHDRLLTSEEIRQVMIDNGIIEGDKNASQEEAQDHCQVDPNQECEEVCEITDEDIIEEIPNHGGSVQKDPNREGSSGQEGAKKDYSKDN